MRRKDAILLLSGLLSPYTALTAPAPCPLPDHLSTHITDLPLITFDYQSLEALGASGKFSVTLGCAMHDNSCLFTSNMTGLNSVCHDGFAPGVSWCTNRMSLVVHCIHTTAPGTNTYYSLVEYHPSIDDPQGTAYVCLRNSPPIGNQLRGMFFTPDKYVKWALPTLKGQVGVVGVSLQEGAVPPPIASAMTQVFDDNTTNSVFVPLLSFANFTENFGSCNGNEVCGSRAVDWTTTFLYISGAATGWKGNANAYSYITTG